MFYTISFLNSEFRVYTADFEPTIEGLGIFKDRDKAVELAMRLNEVIIDFPNPCWIPTKPGVDMYWGIGFDPIDLTFEPSYNYYEGDLFLDSKTLYFGCFETREIAEELAERLRREL